MHTAMGESSPSSVFNDTKYASFLDRFIAYVIDGVVLTLLNLILIGPLLLIANGGNTDSNGGSFVEYLAIVASQGLFMYLILVIVTWLYFAILESGTRQGTLGKMAMGIIVTDIDGDRLSFAKATVRYFGRYASSLFLMFGYALAAFTNRKQALHDFVANTVVVRK